MFTKEGNLVKLARVHVTITNYTCCLNKFHIWNTIMFGSIWVSTSLVLEVKIMKLSPSWHFSPSAPPVRIWELWPWALVHWGDENGQSLSGRRGNSVQMLWKMFARLPESFSMFPPSSVSLSLNRRPGSIAPCTGLWFLVSQRPWSCWLDMFAK